MGQTIVQSNTPSPVALRQNVAIVLSNCLKKKNPNIILNLNMPKNKWGGAEINNFYEIGNRKF